jgi:hypothetical protein
MPRLFSESRLLRTSQLVKKKKRFKRARDEILFAERHSVQKSAIRSIAIAVTKIWRQGVPLSGLYPIAPGEAVDALCIVGRVVFSAPNGNAVSIIGRSHSGNRIGSISPFAEYDRAVILKPLICVRKQMKLSTMCREKHGFCITQANLDRYGP